MPGAPSTASSLGLGAAVRDHRVQLVLSILGESKSERYLLPDLIAATGLSERRLCALFKRETGTSLRQYLKRRRIEKGADLLLATTLIVKQVAFDLGYSAQANFDRDFRGFFGVSPTEYRKRHTGRFVK